jgi:hypothetical protein
VHQDKTDWAPPLHAAIENSLGVEYQEGSDNSGLEWVSKKKLKEAHATATRQEAELYNADGEARTLTSFNLFSLYDCACIEILILRIVLLPHRSTLSSTFK